MNPEKAQVHRAAALGGNGSAQLRPLSERVLAALPGRRVFWIAAWAVVPWLNASGNILLDTEERSAVWEQSSLLVVLNYAALSFATVVTLCGAQRIAQRVEALGVYGGKGADGRDRKSVV